MNKIIPTILLLILVGQLQAQDEYQPKKVRFHKKVLTDIEKLYAHHDGFHYFSFPRINTNEYFAQTKFSGSYYLFQYGDSEEDSDIDSLFKAYRYYEGPEGVGTAREMIFIEYAEKKKTVKYSHSFSGEDFWEDYRNSQFEDSWVIEAIYDKATGECEHVKYTNYTGQYCRYIRKSASKIVIEENFPLVITPAYFESLAYNALKEEKDEPKIIVKYD